LAVPSSAADWPQFRGPSRDGVSQETGLLKTWPKGGPALAWTYTNAGEGYSCPVIVGDRLYTAGARGDTEYLFALDLKNVQGGAPKELWAAPLGKRYFEKVNSWNAGPSATPAVDGGLVYAQGGYGDLVCVRAVDGKEVWRKSLLKDLGGQVANPQGGAEVVGWGFSCSPLVDGDRVVCVPGGKQGNLAALDKKTGNILWRSKEIPEEASYASPVALEVGGARHYVQLTHKRVFGADAKDGKLVWEYAWPEEFDDIIGSAAVVHDGHVYASLGTSSGGATLLKLTPGGPKWKAEKVYSGKDIANYIGGVVLVGGHVYGASDGKGWCCQDFKGGKITWSERRALDRGAVAAADGHLYCVSERGVVALLEATPAEFKEKGRFPLPKESKLRRPSGKAWTLPVIADGKLYLRDQELLFCYSIK
jgi:outer membrane protein assembly factor BamB